MSPTLRTLILVLFPFKIIYYGLVLSILWAWFLTPLGAPSITMLQASGITLTALLPFQNDIVYDTPNTELTLSASWMAPLLFLACGFLIHLFM